MKIYNGVISRSEVINLVTKDHGVNDGDLRIDFTFEEMQRYLLARGYRFCVVEGATEVRDVQSDYGGSNEYIGRPYKKAFTVFMVYNPDLFDNIGTSEIKLKFDLKNPLVIAMQIDHVFKKEIKKQLLGF